MYKPVVRGTLLIHVYEARDLADKDHSLLPFRKNLSDPRAEIFLGQEKVLETKSTVNTLNPKWNARGIVSLCHSDRHIKVKLWDDDYLGKSTLGQVDIPLTPTDAPWVKDEWFPISTSKGEIHMWLKFIPALPPSKILTHEPLDAEYLYFPPHIGGSILLYQDAHVQSLPNLEARRIWESKGNTFSDIADAFERARNFIYIIGWSVYTELQLRRDGKSETIGELLKRRADEGVRVLMILWNEKFSAKMCRELFGTHDAKTVKYFSGTKVTAVSVRREPVDRSKIKENISETIFAHHMKMIVTDCPEKGIIGFVGGLDLTDGRWDTPEHPIWETLTTIHKGDFYNGFVPSATVETGPREPWHDLHCRVEGRVTYDLLMMFDERWRKQAPTKIDLLVPLNLEEVIPLEEKLEGVKWHLQVLRSSTSDSAIFSSSNGGLTDLNHYQKDKSFQHGFVSLIRSCRRFIYIESQYFLGSSFAWESNQDVCAPNLIPLEIVEQIKQSIRVGNPIRAYVVVPMCPEGDPKSFIGACYMGDILHWQFLTIQMMFLQIAATLKEIGSDDHPEDYLVILCLGNKQQRQRTSRQIPNVPKNGTDPYLWQIRSRFIIYVHSKMALVDDARIILGSANLNERSLDGGRDTESGIAGSQVKYSGKNDKQGELVEDGDVAEFRRCLWFEHTGGESEENPVFADPSSKECIAAIRNKAEESLFQFMDDEVDKDVSFRFMKYPLKVEKNGHVVPYPNIPTLPDFELPVTGKKSFIPPIITT